MNLRNKQLSILVSTLLLIGCSGGSEDSNEDLLLGLVAGRQIGISEASRFQGTLRFDARFQGRPISCGDQTYTMPAGQVVQMRDFRLFVQDVVFVRKNGSKVRMQMNPVPNWQLREGNDQLALLDFTIVGAGKCVGTSDDDKIRNTIEGRISNETFESVEVTIGVPNKWNHVDRDVQPPTSPLRAGTGLPWSWLAGFKFIRLELEGTGSMNKRLLLHLGSTNCTGDINIPQGQPGSVSCANSYRPTLVLKPEGGFNPVRDTILFDVDEFFRGNGGVPTTAFDPTVPTPLSCMPIGNGLGQNGTPTTCGPILKNLGLVPGNQAGFNNTLVTENGVGTVNLNTQQPILKVVR